MTPRILGLDIGGANLKAATNDGFAALRPFALWQRPEHLATELRAMVHQAPTCHQFAVTMTGELCDCYETKRQGVQAILDAVTDVAGERRIDVWLTSQYFAHVAEARERWLEAAAANWLALATWAGRFAPRGGALLIDIGSTTTDIVALQDGRPIPQGRTDSQRLKTHELVYSGARRTPVCALMGDEVTAEVFATMLDVFLVLGMIADDPEDLNTADGRPATRKHARVRLARMLGGDGETTSDVETLILASRTALRQRIQLFTAAQTVAALLPEPPQTVILSGSGEFIAVPFSEFDSNGRKARVLSLRKELGPNLSASACAYAVAVLAGEISGRLE